MQLSAEDWDQRGIAANNRQEYEEAADCFERAVEANPRWPLAHLHYGVALVRLGQHLPALQCFLRALQLDPDNAEAHFHLGSVIQEYGDLLIEDAYDTALDLQPDLVGATSGLGKLHYDRGDYVKALALFKTAVQHNVNDIDAYNHMGLCYASLGDFAKARKYWLKSASLDVNNYFAHLNLAALYATDFAFERALSHLERAFHLVLAQAHEDMQAMPQFDELRLDPRCQKLLRDNPAPKTEAELVPEQDPSPIG